MISEKKERKDYLKKSNQAIKEGMISSFDLSPGDLVVQKYWTEYQPKFRDNILGSYTTSKKGTLLYLGVKRRLVDSNSKHPNGYVYVFWSFETKSETWIFQGYPSYLRGKTFDVLGNIFDVKGKVKREKKNRS